MSDRLSFDLNMEPELAEPEVVPDGEVVLARSLPLGFNLPALLRFLPDVRLKQKADAAAAEALAIDVTAEGGLVHADNALVPLRASIAAIEVGFEDPVSLANQLHKRLTGLRGDFSKVASDALALVSRRIYAEKKRQDDLAREAQRQAQEVANAQARAEAAAAAKAAQQAGQSKQVVTVLKQQAKVAVAAPVVSPLPAPVLASTSTVPKWKARFVGTPAEAEPNPEVGALTEAQQGQMRGLIQAVLDGKAPLAFFQINWSLINKKAQAEKTTFLVPFLEAFDEGGTRAKARR